MNPARLVSDSASRNGSASAFGCSPFIHSCHSTAVGSSAGRVAGLCGSWPRQGPAPMIRMRSDVTRGRTTRRVYPRHPPAAGRSTTLPKLVARRRFAAALAWAGDPSCARIRPRSGAHLSENCRACSSSAARPRHLFSGFQPEYGASRRARPARSHSLIRTRVTGTRAARGPPRPHFAGRPGLPSRSASTRARAAAARARTSPSSMVSPVASSPMDGIPFAA